MTKQFYQDKNFRTDSLILIDQVNEIVRNFQRQGYTLSVRQLYYQLVAKALIENTLQSYKRVTGIVNDARLAGLIDWDAIEDRTREFVQRQRWTRPQEILRVAGTSYHMDMWENQRGRVFVIVEKEALVGVLHRVCHKFDVPLLAARGYPSGTVLREFARDMVMPALSEGQDVLILHLGDHDPSGIDMTRDLRERIEMFAEYSTDYSDGILTLERIALSMQQVEEQRPPPNPAKSTDSRFADYRRIYGTASWELDALTPQYINDLVQTHIEAEIDDESWDDRAAEVERGRKEIERVTALVNFD